MTVVTAIGLLLVAISGAGLATVFVLYPLGLALHAVVTPRRPAPGAGERGEPPTVAFIVVARNAEKLIEAKIRNTLALDDPPARLEIVLCSDGSTDDTFEIMTRSAGPGAQCLRSVEHVGKAEMLNRAARATSAELLVFSDADAILPADAISKLTAQFADPAVGGVCGARRIRRNDGTLRSGQATYRNFDRAIKLLESRAGSLSSNDGKLYAIRRELFREVPPDVTDDLYACLGVLRRGARFVFEPRAVADVPAPARSAAHEVTRRRRIVSRSLRALWGDRALLLPWRHPQAALRLGVNKVCRRLLPLWMVGLLVGSAVLAPWHNAFLALLIAQAVFYGAGCACPLVRRLGLPRAAESVCAIPLYFVLGNTGTALGWLDFLRGRSAQRWDPQKGEEGDEGDRAATALQGAGA